MLIWDDALGATGQDDELAHAVRFGPRLRAEAVLSGTPDADRRIGYLTNAIDHCHEVDLGVTGARRPAL